VFGVRLPRALAQRRVIGDGSNPPHSVTLFLGLRESDE
jgi:hypothetical protein